MNSSGWYPTDVTEEGRQQCAPGMHYGMLYFAIIPICQIIINVIVIVAVVHSRRKLRHNFVYVYVINTLTANLLFGVFSLYELLNLVLAFERNWNSAEPFRSNGASWLGWWAFRAGMIVCLFIAMSGSISALIYGIRESSYFIGRTVKPKSSTRKDRKLHNRRAMWSIIFSNWIIPLILCIACAAGWSCVEHCECTPAFYGENIYPCRSDIHTECSRIMLPLRKNFTLVSTILWFLESLGIVFMIITTVKKYKVAMASKRYNQRTTISSIYTSDQGDERKKSLQVDPVPRNSSNNAINSEDRVSQNVKSHISIDDQISMQNSCISVRTNQPTKDSISIKGLRNRCINLPPLNHNIKLLLTISIFFLLCTTPVMCIVIIDSVSEDYALSYLGVVMPYVICLCYSSVSPLVLVYYMAGLKTALMRMLFRCSCLTKTITVSNSVTSASD